jgi:hypothetical protein
LQYLHAKWAAHLPYRQATAMMKEVLPLEKGISFSGTRGRIRTLGKQLDADIERDIAKLPQAVADVQVRESSHVAAVSVDSAWLQHSDSERGLGRHVNIIAGRSRTVRQSCMPMCTGKSSRLQRDSISSLVDTVWRPMNA